VPKVVARVNNPRNQPTFDLLDVDATVCAATMMISMIQHELPSHQFVPLLSLKRENMELVEIEVSDDSPSAHLAVADIRLPGDQVLCLLAPGREKELIRSFLPSRKPEDVQAQASIDTIVE
jgi:Trk K+ transport system NAD-binding subunit